MSELQEFVKKITTKFPGISVRRLYGLDAFYLNDKAFIIITSNDEIAVKVEDFQTKKDLKTHKATEWRLDGKLMENWFLLPKTFNKKKNKLIPILEITSKVLLHPKKEKMVRKKKNNSKKFDSKVIDSQVPKKRSLFERLFKSNY